MARYNYSSAGLKPHTSVDRSRDDLTASIIIVTYLGRLEYRKGVHILAAAIPIIRKELPQVRFKFIGSDTLTAPDGGSMQAYASSMAQPYADAIEFTGLLPRH